MYNCYYLYLEYINAFKHSAAIYFSTFSGKNFNIN